MHIGLFKSAFWTPPCTSSMVVACINVANSQQIRQGEKRRIRGCDLNHPVLLSSGYTTTLCYPPNCGASQNIRGPFDMLIFAHKVGRGDIMIHTASCSTSHRVGDRGIESVGKKVCAQAILRLQKAQCSKLGRLTGSTKRSRHVCDDLILPDGNGPGLKREEGCGRL